MIRRILIDRGGVRTGCALRLVANATSILGDIANAVSVTLDGHAISRRNDRIGTVADVFADVAIGLHNVGASIFSLAANVDPAGEAEPTFPWRPDPNFDPSTWPLRFEQTPEGTVLHVGVPAVLAAGFGGVWDGRDDPRTCEKNVVCP